MQLANPGLQNQLVQTNNPTDLIARQHSQLANIDNTAYATRRGLEMAASVMEYGLAAYDVSAGRMLAYRDQPRSPEHQALVDDYASQSLHILKSDFRAIETIGIMTIARHIGRELLEGDDGHMR